MSATRQQRRAEARALKKTAKLIGSMTQEQHDALGAKYCSDPNTPPHEIAKRLAREYLASEVRDKLKADHADGVLDVPPHLAHITPPGATLFGFIDSIDDNNVITLLEALVEGDLIIDDGGTHQWFRKKLDDYRESESKMEAGAYEMEALATTIGLTQAMDHFDILLDTVAEGDVPNSFGVLANEAARAILSPDGWAALLPEKVEGFGEGWMQTRLTANGDVTPPPTLQSVAQTIANATSLRVGIMKRYGNVDAVLPAEQH